MVPWGKEGMSGEVDWQRMREGKMRNVGYTNPNKLQIASLRERERKRDGEGRDDERGGGK